MLQNLSIRSLESFLLGKLLFFAFPGFSAEVSVGITLLEFLSGEKK